MLVIAKTATTILPKAQQTETGQEIMIMGKESSADGEEPTVTT